MTLGGVTMEKVFVAKVAKVTNLFGPAATTCLYVGNAGTTGHSLASEDDLCVTGKLEINGAAYFDGALESWAAAAGSNDSFVGAASDGTGIFTLTTNDSTDQTLFAVRTEGGMQLILTALANRTKDHDHTAQTNPTLFIHSATDPDTANTQWVSITHNQTDGVIDCGTGTLNLGATGNVNFAGATATGSADAAMNAYVTLEVAGVAKKFMLTA